LSGPRPFGPVSEHHRSALRRVQRRLENFYGLERAPDIVDFVRTDANGGRETLLVRESDGELEIALILPPLDPQPCEDGAADDAWLQLVEGVSHFVYIAERARTNLPATRLELELQAEVDKFVLLALGKPALDRRRARSLHGALYERVRFLHAPDTEAGERYRLANDLAARFVARLFARREPQGLERVLRRFYRSGQAEKIRLARAA
jgi:hypothetical protein